MIGKTIGNYKIVELIGTGGMAAVYKAHEIPLDRTVALKVLSDRFAKDRLIVERFKREARSAARLNHPHIIQIYAICEGDSLHFIAMEYVEGTTLRDLIDKKKKFSQGEIFEIVVPICDALHYAHRRNVIHRDIKPGNIILGKDSSIVKITDFGIAKVLDSDTLRLTIDGTLMGTPQFMSPEQIQGEDLDARADIYSLGILLFEMITGRVPFDGNTPLAIAHKQIYKQPPRLSSLVEDIPPEIERIVAKCLEKKPEKRYQDAYEIIVDIHQFKKENKAALKGAKEKGVPLAQGVSQQCEKYGRRAEIKQRTQVFITIGKNFLKALLFIVLVAVISLAGIAIVTIPYHRVLKEQLRYRLLLHQLEHEALDILERR